MNRWATREIVIPVHGEAGQEIALAMEDAAGALRVGAFRQEGLAQAARRGDPAQEGQSVQRLVGIAGQHAHRDRPFGIIEAAGDEAALGIDQLDNLPRGVPQGATAQAVAEDPGVPCAQTPGGVGGHAEHAAADARLHPTRGTAGAGGGGVALTAPRRDRTCGCAHFACSIRTWGVGRKFRAPRRRVGRLSSQSPDAHRSAAKGRKAGPWRAFLTFGLTNLPNERENGC